MVTEPSDREHNQQQSTSARIARALADARRELIDLSRHNRLLHATRTGKRPHCLELLGAEPDLLFQNLTGTSKAYGFLPEEESGELFKDAGNNSRRAFQLQTKLNQEALDRRLLKFYREARTYEEEQGVNILFVALGFLKWFEEQRSEEACFAPLLLVPVSLERKQGKDQYLLRGRDDDLIENVSLREKLRVIAGIDLPKLPETEDWRPSQYFDSVAAAVEGQQGWNVDGSGVGLGFFTFSKFLMWRDLDGSNWPDPRLLLSHPLISGLLGEASNIEAVSPLANDDEPIDRKVDLASAIHVLDADSSQALVIEEARLKHDLVVQGPPGTGKSQTIANIIATTVHEGRSVLFVAEKAAALDVVHSRLKAVGLEPLCLEIHSRKANKLAVVASLERSLRASGVSSVDPHGAPTLREIRDRLNRWTEKLHAPVANTKRTPYRIMGTILKLRADGTNFDHAVFSERINTVADWSEGKLCEAEQLVDQIGRSGQKLDGPPKDHPWYGTQGRRLAALDLDRLSATLTTTAANIRSVQEIDHQFRELGAGDPPTLEDLCERIDIFRLLIGKTEACRVALTNSAWRTERPRISRLVEYGRAWATRGTRFRETVTEHVWNQDLSVLRDNVAAYGNSPVRFLIGRYRRALVGLKAVCRNAPPKAIADRLDLLDDLIAGKNAILELAKDEEFAKSALGPLWASEHTAWETVAALIDDAASLDTRKNGWAIALRTLQNSARTCIEPGTTDKPIADLRENLVRLSAILKPNLAEIAKHPTWEQIPLSDISDLLKTWSVHLNSYDDWVVARDGIAKLRELELAPLADCVTTGAIKFDVLRTVFDLFVADALWERACKEDPALEEFDGTQRSELVDDFCERDWLRIEQARVDVLTRYIEKKPTGTVGEMGTIRDEIGKKRRHLPIRKLMERAGSAIQRLKPVFLMSPLSAAQFLPPGKMMFDLMVIDEASQVPPEDALGVVARARQIVIVGDDKQLPPTNFFRMVTSDDDDDEAFEDSSVSRTRDFESILTLGRARGVPERMLKWHYRSRHPSLIALSNVECYGNALLLPPSPFSTDDGLGLSLIRTPRGHYERGASGRNPVEAGIVADAIEKHLRDHPEQSLGVACFSVRQREAIEDALHQRGLTSATDGFAPKGERFFVKNLETVQGDERDVIMISVGYGYDAQNRMTGNLGPVSRDGGERRLNVLISRARSRCIVYSSIGAEDISADWTTRGTRMLREFLHFAETGKIAAGTVTGGDFDSPFEEAVALAIKQAGYRVVPQVGVSGFRVDLGVLHPEQPGRFALGIECDGASYHSGRSARDRDRLRQEILENMGWRLHRIWSSDWFRNPSRETERLRIAIKVACETMTTEEPSENSSPELDRSASNFRTDTLLASPSNRTPDHTTVTSPRIEKYVECRLSVPRGINLLDLAPHRLAELSTIVVTSEGPVHTEEVARRVREAFGLERTGARILSAIKSSLRTAERAGAVKSHMNFWITPSSSAKLPRDRRQAALPLRRADRIAPQEYDAAISLVLEYAVGCSHDELIVETARLLGFDRTGTDLQTAIRQQIKSMCQRGELEIIGERIRATHTAS